MNEKLPQSSLEQRLAEYLERARQREMRELMLFNTRRLLWLHFLIGMARGFGMVIGGSLVVTLLSLLLAYLAKVMGWLPPIQAFLERIQQVLLTGQ